MQKDGHSSPDHAYEEKERVADVPRRVCDDADDKRADEGARLEEPDRQFMIRAGIIEVQTLSVIEYRAYLGSV